MSEKNKGSLIALIKVIRTDCDVTNYVSTYFKNVSVKRLKIMEDFTLHCLLFDKIDEPDDRLIQLKKISNGYIRAGKNKIWTEGRSCRACNFFSKSNNVLGSKSIGNSTVIYRILLPNRNRLKEMEREMEDAHLNYQIIEYYPSNEVELTEREKFVINKIFNGGYFNNERKSSLTELANSMDISTTSLSETMRIALKKIIKNYIDDNIN